MRHIQGRMRVAVSIVGQIALAFGNFFLQQPKTQGALGIKVQATRIYRSTFCAMRRPRVVIHISTTQIAEPHLSPVDPLRHPSAGGCTCARTPSHEICASIWQNRTQGTRKSSTIAVHRHGSFRIRVQFPTHGHLLSRVRRGTATHL